MRGERAVSAPSGSRAGVPGMARRRESSSAMVYADLRHRILRLDLEPGAAISETDIAHDYQVSRTPVREAIQRLTAEGLVDVQSKSGTYVARIPLALLPEAIIVRKALEEVTARHAARRATGSQILELSARLARQREIVVTGDFEAFHQADEQFHATIAAMAGYPGIWRLVESAKMQVDRFRRLTLPQEGRMERVIREHGAVLQAIESHDEEGAVLAMGRHIDGLEVDIDALHSLSPGFFEGDIAAARPIAS
jgi:GntR family transcriptional regulator, rspAB operon transcriptional repressor